ncbi:Ribosome biogenesis protein Nop16, putative [Trypanosoma equiperdum]|uniref:Nucleolar protein 16 n=1 Tax=Trypanosoma equiperdum TaxID=5694 RepID=A0A1G4I7Y5_TRYEQ|nr:Ribosome biogenesis protein Nop16, putative [Trypanosoma equiperdum]
MGRIRVTPKGKAKKNIPITRSGRKKYLKRRFAHLHQIDKAGSNNYFTKKYFKRFSTASSNFKSLGLAKDPSITPKKIVDEPSQPTRRLEEENELEELRQQRKGTLQVRRISEEEAVTMANLIRKHQTDFKAMSLDRKLNPYQLNPRQLQRQVVNYLRWEKAAFPEAFAEAEANGWLSIEEYANPKNRYRKE